MPRKIDVIGRRFGRLVVISDAPRKAGARRSVFCVCDCGEKRVVDPRMLLGGRTKSCGCFQRDVMSVTTPRVHTTHGRTRTAEYNTWVKIKNRCGNENDPKYKDYGGRGIAVCDEWASDFMAFLRDVGEKPRREYSIDRIDVNGDYEPGNCRWADALTQSRNKRRTRLVEYLNTQMPLSQACSLANVNYRAALYRLNVGKDWRPLPSPPKEG